MSSTSGPATKSTARIRIDVDHHVQEMMQAAVARLQRDNIDVRLTGDSVVLQGAVRSWTQKQSIQESIRLLSNSRVIRNELQVCQDW